MAADPLLPIDRVVKKVPGTFLTTALWEAVLAGRLRFTDAFERDGRRYVVARWVAPGSGALRGLSVLERRAAEDLGRGLAPKEIAWTLEAAPSTVANALGRARRKLGLGSLAELAALFAPCGLASRLVELEIDGERLAVASCALADPARLAPLSAAEREVARLLVSGASNRVIAQRRGAAERTVANQVRAIYRKLGVASRAELAARLQGAIA
jgi:DNA-binding CsgD family transcriptional regulator